MRTKDSKLSRAALAGRLSEIRLLSLDVDGVLTDGGIYFGDDGLTLRKFNVKDGLGIQRAMAVGVEVAVISAGPQDAIRHRMKRLGVQHVFIDVKDKLGTLSKLCSDLGIALSEVAHMGDDLNDLVAIESVGCSISVPNAVPEILARVDFITDLPGGAGAVREICDMMVASRADV